MMKKMLMTVATVAVSLLMQAQYADLYYHRLGDTMLARVPWNLADSHRYVHIASNGVNNNHFAHDSCCSYVPWERTVALYEYYFDGPISVAQTEWDTVNIVGNTHPVCNIDTAAGHYGFTLRSISA